MKVRTDAEEKFDTKNEDLFSEEVKTELFKLRAEQAHWVMFFDDEIPSRHSPFISKVSKKEHLK